MNTEQIIQEEMRKLRSLGIMHEREIEAALRQAAAAEAGEATRLLRQLYASNGADKRGVWDFLQVHMTKEEAAAAQAVVVRAAKLEAESDDLDFYDDLDY